MTRPANETKINSGYNASKSILMLHSPEQRIRSFIPYSYGKYASHESPAVKTRRLLDIANKTKNTMAGASANNGWSMSTAIVRRMFITMPNVISMAERLNIPVRGCNYNTAPKHCQGVMPHPVALH